MKRKTYLIIAVVAITGALAFNSVTNSNKSKVSAVTLANVEALTQPETWETCPNGCKEDAAQGCWCYEWFHHLREGNAK